MRKVITAVAAATILLTGSLVWKAEATTPSGVGNLSPLA
jgi:hypothetical protein